MANSSLFSSLTPQESDQFLAELREDKKWPYADDAAKKELELKTRAAVLISEIGYLGCEACARSGPTGDERLEGHHPGERVLKISEYRHNVKPRFRQQALKVLVDEVRHRIQYLCKTHHEAMHHAQRPSVSRTRCCPVT